MAIDTHSNGPNYAMVVLSGILILLLGGFLGIISLVTQPVDSLTREPDPDKLVPGEVYYVKGARRGQDTWSAKEVALKNRQLNQLILSESELNQWSQRRLSMSEEAEGEAGWLTRLRVTANPVNFRIHNDKVQMGTELKFPGILPDTEVLYFVTGEFDEQDGRLVFIPETGNVGHAPLGSVPVAREWLFNIVAGQFTKNADLVWLGDALGEFEAVDIRDNQLVFSRTSAD